MVFRTNLVACIKVGNKILRETNDSSPVVFLPFSSEFSILMKNLSTQKAEVKVSIDGTDVLNGLSLIINPNSDLELERFLSDLNIGSKFLFIEKTEQISEFRGDRIDDGIVRIEYQYEKVVPLVTDYWHHNYYHTHSFDRLGIGSPTSVYYGACGGSQNCVDTLYVSSTNQVEAKSMLRSVTTASADGITVKGSISEQKFQHGYIGALEEQTHVITLQLKGITDQNAPVQKPLTTKMKCKCETCGAVYRGFPAYCNKCGTAINAAI
jgi:hypothetical protein